MGREGRTCPLFNTRRGPGRGWRRVHRGSPTSFDLCMRTGRRVCRGMSMCRACVRVKGCVGAGGLGLGWGGGVGWGIWEKPSLRLLCGVPARKD